MSGGLLERACQGRRVPAGGPGTVDAGRRQRSEGPRWPPLSAVHWGTGPLVVVRGRRAEGQRRVNSIA
jgi:hypothetical protein